MMCYIRYVSVISHHWWYITFHNDYITGHITCYITSFATSCQHMPFNHQHCHHRLAHAPPCAASASPLPVVEHHSFVPCASAQPLSFCHCDMPWLAPPIPQRLNLFITRLNLFRLNLFITRFSSRPIISARPSERYEQLPVTRHTVPVSNGSQRSLLG
jgi:hypothetical protein